MEVPYLSIDFATWEEVAAVRECVRWVLPAAVLQPIASVAAVDHWLALYSFPCRVAPPSHPSLPPRLPTVPSLTWTPVS